MIDSKRNITVIDAIRARHSSRNFTAKKLERDAIIALVDAGVRAPTAMHQEPWAFAVVQNSDLLRRISTISKKLFVDEIDHAGLDRGGHDLDAFRHPDFNIFYNATTLIVICAQQRGHFEIADCWLAAENLMLAACAEGLGTCVIGSAVAGLNTEEIKSALDIPPGMVAIAPIIIGVPNGDVTTSPRKTAKILSWK